MASKNGSKKSGSASAGKAGNKNAADKSAAQTAAADKPKRSYKRKPIMVRATKLVDQLGKKAAALLRMIRWSSENEETSEQTDALNTIEEAAKGINPRVEEVAAGLQVLVTTKWEPKSGSSGRRTLTVGNKVVIKDKFYEPEMHGEPNQFVVRAVTDRFVRIAGVETDPAETAGFPIEKSRVKFAGTDAPAAESTGEDDD